MASDTLTDGKEIDREEVVTRLNSFAALRVMSPADLRELANRIEPRTLEQDAMLQEMQASGDYLYLVESGALRETGKDSDGTVWWERTQTVVRDPRAHRRQRREVVVRGRRHLQPPGDL